MGDFGTSYIRPGGDSNAPTTIDDPRLRNERPYGAYFFAALTGRIGGRDVFLDGNMISASHSVDKEIVVGDFIVGANLVFRRFKLSDAQVFRSREFEGQIDKPNFGTISLSFAY